MKRAISILLITLLSASSMLLTGCGYDFANMSQKDKNYIRNMANVIYDHGHGRYTMIDKMAIGLLILITILDRMEYFVDKSPFEAPPEAKAFEQRVENSPREDLAIEPTASNPYYDHALDGVWICTNRIYTSSDYRGKGILPFIIVANASPEGWNYVSVVFQNVNDCIGKGKAGWSAFYTNEFINKKGYSRFYFDLVSSQALKDIMPYVRKLKFSYSTYPNTGDSFMGVGKGYKQNGKDQVFSTNDKFHRMKSAGIYGLWSSGVKERVYAGEFMEQPMFHPVNILLAQTSNGPDMFFNVMYSTREEITPTVTGNRLQFYYYSSNGKVDGDLMLTGGNKLVGKIWDPLAQKYKQLTFNPAGTEGKSVKVKRVKPKAIKFDKKGKQTTIKIFGQNFVPGAMVFFSNKNLSIESIKYLNKRSMSVKVSPLVPIKKGTKIGVRVVNPDNRLGENHGAIRVK